MRFMKIRVLTRKTIMGCDGRGDGESPYLTRLVIIDCPLGAAYLHYFHRSDADEFHDHPWNFASLILWRGYFEVTTSGHRRYWPGMVLFRGAPTLTVSSWFVESQRLRL